MKLLEKEIKEFAIKLENYGLSQAQVKQFMLRIICLRILEKMQHSSKLKILSTVFNDFQTKDSIALELDKSISTLMKILGVPTESLSSFSFQNYVDQDDTGKLETLIDFIIFIKYIDLEDKELKDNGGLFSLVLSEISLIHKDSEYTPSGISELFSRLISGVFQKNKKYDFYSPCIGYGELAKSSIYPEYLSKLSGQDISADSIAVAAMNFCTHGIEEFDLKIGNTLTNPLFLNNNESVAKYDCIVASLPQIKNWLLQDNQGIEYIKFNCEKDRFNRFNQHFIHGSRSDYAFIFHILNSMRDNGIAVIMVNLTTLYRSIDGFLREDLIGRMNVVDSIITLGKNIRIKSKSDHAILILKKNRDRNDIVFIDATNKKLLQRSKYHNELKPESIINIANTYLSFYKGNTEICNKGEIITKVVNINDIQRANYSMNLAYYETKEDFLFDEKVLSEEKEKLVKISEKIQNRSKELENSRLKIQEYFIELMKEKL